jgi:cation diffusion facilitator CzcD-associated flavoprotein CzcO
MDSAPDIAIVGAGMSGLCMGVKLRQAGIDSFTIHEKAGSVGGTWRENTYPGLSCDVPSRFYSYSFAPNPDWSRHFSPGREIWAYFDGIAERYGLGPHIRFDSEIVAARHDGERWRLRTAAGGEQSADFLISATGVLHHPRYPDIDGLDSFAGAAFHSARWDHSVALAGRRIGVVGTGSTGVQITCALAGVAGRYSLFQRTAQWVLHVPNRRYSRLTKWALHSSPALNRLIYRGAQARLEHTFGEAVVRPGWQRRMLAAACRRNLDRVVDPELQRKLTPDYEPMCKRLVLSGEFYDAIQKPNVELVTEPIERIEPQGIRTADGSLHDLDVLVLATGFDAHAYMRPMHLVGPNGETLDDIWPGEPHGYLTVALPGFPNLFCLMGPHSPVGNQSLVSVAETQADYAIWFIKRFRAGELATASPTAAATARFNAQLRAAMPQTVWTTGCNSWYIGADGLPMLWPWTPRHHREMLAEPRLADFDVAEAPRGSARGVRDASSAMGLGRRPS